MTRSTVVKKGPREYRGPFECQASRLLSVDGRDCRRRVEAMDVALRVLEHRPSAPGFSARGFGELDLLLCKLLLCLVDVINLQNYAA
jgi:hypothetical protein